jgi:hypothetical protein
MNRSAHVYNPANSEMTEQRTKIVNSRHLKCSVLNYCNFQIWTTYPDSFPILFNTHPVDKN